MVSSELFQTAIIFMVALGVGIFAYVLISPYFGDRQAQKRLASASEGAASRRLQKTAKQPLSTRRKQVQDTVKELEAKNKERKRIDLRTRIQRAGFSFKPRTYYLLSFATGFVAFIAVLLLGSPLWVGALAGFAAGVGLPRFVLNKAADRRQTQFIVEFANAIDIIVRGIKTGLPLGDCLQIIANEASEPVKSAFVDIVEQQRVGIPLPQAFLRMHERMPLQEVNFFSIVIAIQSQTGGNLAEALSNLSQVLRARQQLRSKVKAYSAEAKASAMIIGALPIVVMLAVYVLTPDYIGLLFTDPIGNILLGVSGVWMLFGVLVMRQMINFDF
ncbi:type IV pilin biogenesis protein [Methyloligella halotolerans]|uniref:Type IV pilin biogenesis protein n=1 Tax=Methyloligella halotolerans TaxID=1177755 RepID=A0A1E2RW02_9HYPH|nr:type II secretion system F family protein [Methyloligella halotolerans]ODA66393.1 type IV pilin biogenesis protein [Methyloligella halotolerans]